MRDYGRGIPLGKVVDVVSKINTGAKYDSKAFQKSRGPERCGYQGGECTQQLLYSEAFRDGRMKSAEFERAYW